MIFKGLRLDPFQRSAIDHVAHGKSVIVAAPTGAGKTLVAEYAVDHALAQGEQIVYTAPIKALSNQKYRDFAAQYPGQVGIVTGDVSMNPKAAVVIMTTEIFRNIIFDAPARLAGVKFVVFDEIHYLGDMARGTVWEEAIIFAPQHIRFICLSATIPNLDDLAAWMTKVRDIPVEVVESAERPVPLEHMFSIDGMLADDLRDWRRTRRRPDSPSPRQGRKGTAHDPLLEFIRDQDDVPCLYFAFNRRQCERLAKQHQWLKLLDAPSQEQILRLYDELAARYGIEATSQYAGMRPLIARGVAYHHAGMLPSMKVVVEQLFTSRLLKLVFTTETFALGINMPAKTVVFDTLTKFDGTDYRPMLTREYYQMAGRAGRRGLDAKGCVISKVDTKRISRKDVREIVYGQPEPVASQFNSCYATILNLYDLLGEDIYDTYARSFHAFMSGKRQRRRGQEQLRLKVKLLKALGYVDGAGLSDKGRCAARLYGHELVATELILSGAMDELPPTSVAVLTMGILFESRERHLSPRDRRAAGRLPSLVRGIVTRVQNAEAKLGLEDMTPSPDFGLSAVVAAWAGGASFDDVLHLTASPEGHVVRDLRRVALLLRQMAAVSEGRDVLQARLREAIRAVDRDVVDAERQLRNEVPCPGGP